MVRGWQRVFRIAISMESSVFTAMGPPSIDPILVIIFVNKNNA